MGRQGNKEWLESKRASAGLAGFVDLGGRCGLGERCPRQSKSLRPRRMERESRKGREEIHSVTKAFSQAVLDCPFQPRMLGSKAVASARANPLKSDSPVPGRLAQWLQSTSAEVWVKFLLALVGLGLAFASALFSTVSRDAGNQWATIILASTSL